MYASSFNSSDKGNVNPRIALDSVSWERVAANGGHNFTYKGMSPSVRHGVIHWVTKCGRWVLVTATPLREYQRCLRQGGTGIQCGLAFQVPAVAVTELCDMWQIRVELTVLPFTWRRQQTMCGLATGVGQPAVWDRHSH